MTWLKHSHKKHRSAADFDGDEPAIISINAAQQTISQANRIYFYSEINNDTVLELNKQIDEASRQMQIVQITLELPAPPAIKLYINSCGGDVSAGFCAADKIRNCIVPIHTYCEGEIASAATFISVSGKKRFMTKNAFFLIHQLSSQFWGKYAEFEDEIQNLSMMMERIKNIYRDNTSIPPNELDNLLKHDLYIPPETCMAWKMVDEII